MSSDGFLRETKFSRRQSVFAPELRRFFFFFFSFARWLRLGGGDIMVIDYADSPVRNFICRKQLLFTRFRQVFGSPGWLLFLQSHVFPKHLHPLSSPPSAPLTTRRYLFFSPPSESNARRT